jgi:hypothetical protein
LTGKEKLDQASAGGARAAAGPENSGANCARKESCQEMREGARSGSGVKATGAKPAGAQQQPETRQARSREKGAGALSRSAAVFDALQIGAGVAAARPAAIEPRNSVQTTL